MKKRYYIRVCDCGKIVTRDDKGKTVKIGMLDWNPEYLQSKEGYIRLVFVKDCCTEILQSYEEEMD